MKKIFTYLFFTSLSLSAFCQFTPGHLVIARVGTGGTTTLRSNIAAPVFIDEITTTGTAVQSVSIPYLASQVSGANKQLTAAGTSSNDAMLTVSGNGAYFTVTGYTADTGTATVSTAPGITRTIALIGVNGSINTSTLVDTATGNARCAVTNDGTGFWQVGSNKGLRYVHFGNTCVGTDTAVYVSKTVTNFRSVQIFGGNLVTGCGSGTIARVGMLTGLPTTAGQTIANFPGLSLALTANSVYLTSLPGGPAGLNTMYIADDASTGSPGLKKFSLNGGTGNWDSTGIIDAAGTYRAMAAVTAGGTVTLYAVKAGNTLNSIVDATGYGVAPTATPTLVLKSATNTAFRGVAFVPTSLPVHLLSFNAARDDAGKANIWWVVSTETDMANYVVEKSIDSKNFTEIGFVAPKGLSNYNFYDEKTISVTTYYRVKFLDKDGKFTYSNVVAVTPKKSISLEVFPNPVKSTAVVSYPKATVGSNIRVTNLEGKTLINQAVQEGSVQTGLDLSRLVSGNYIVLFTDAEGNKTTKTIIK